MKNKAIKITATSIAIFFSLNAFAQQAVTAKAPEVSGPVLQAPTENKTAVAAPANETKLHETATKKSSMADEPKLVKGKDDVQPAKAPEQKPLPETNKLTPPPSSYPVKKDN